MNKIKGLLLLILAFPLNCFSQIIIDDFTDPNLLAWVPGSSKITLQHHEGALLVTADSVGANYEGFGKTFSALDMSKYSVITMRIKVADSLVPPRIRMDIRDNNGYDSNRFPVIVTADTTGEYITYRFDYTGRFSQSYPKLVGLDSKKIVRMYFFINPGPSISYWSGSFHIDDIILEGAQRPDIFSFGSEWKYFTGGIEQPNWKTVDFDDSNWNVGTSPIGYGFPDISSAIVDDNPKTITQYFRKEIYISDTSAYNTLVLNARAGDGMALYLNEEEIYRSNLPEGPLTESTLALNQLTAVELDEIQRIVIPITPLDSGMNVITAEVHRNDDSGEYLVFDLGMTASVYNFGVIRGPYLQNGTDTSMVIRWRTLERMGTRVKIGTSPDNLATIVDSTGFTTDHEVLVTGLQPDTKYYYGIGTADSTYKGGDDDHYFITNPAVGSEEPVRIWAIGDAGTGNSSQRLVRDSYYNYTAGTHTDAFLLLGDNAYNDGFDSEYQSAMFENMYEGLLNKTVCWPTPGNHDVGFHLSMAAEAPYYDIFTVPVGGEAGGVPSGTESYYSFNYGNIHFISLDSHGTPRDSIEAMGTWLKNDLNENSQKWTIAYFHHPPYTKGTHDSDDDGDSGGRLKEIREQIVPLLEAGGVDLVLTGHSHVYERSYMIHGHYGYSSTFLDQPHIVNEVSSGKRSLGEEYYKNPVHNQYPNVGTVYPVLGCSGMTSNKADWEKQPDNLISKSLMYTYSRTDLGSLVLDVHKDTLTARFLTGTGTVKDDFTIIKDNNHPIALVEGEIKLGINNGYNNELNLLKVYPNPFAESISLQYTLKKTTKVQLEVFDEIGRKVETLSSGKQSPGTYEYKFSANKGGTYVVKLTTGKDTYTKKIMLVK